MRPAFSSRLSWPEPANALSIARASLQAGGQMPLNWSESNPRRVLPLEGYEEPELAPLFNEAANLRYEPDPRGLLRAREALAAHGQLSGASGAIDASRYFLAASSSEAYSWLFKLLCDPGDAVLVPKPGYPLFDFLAGLEGVEARPWRLEYLHPAGWKVDFDSVEAAIRGDASQGRSSIARGSTGRVKAIILINPNNPTGSFISGEERRRFVEIAAREGLALIVDEVFLGFPVEGEGRSFLGEEAALTFVLDGLSKRLGLPQLKLGWIAASGPQDLLQEALEGLETIADTFLSAGTPVMNALPALLAAGPRFAHAMGARLRANLSMLRGELEFPGSPHRVYRCEGGWTAIVESPRYAGEEDLALHLLTEAGLYSQPGHFFDMEREAAFTAGLILPPARFAEGARIYRNWYEAAAR
ncbi:MAG: pyridoxal phosphate-dependent aminotransferase [Spirochaetota bacterium]